MKCNRNDCISEATQGVAIMIPAKDIPIPEHDPLKLVLGIEVCDECLGKMTAQEFLEANPKLRPLLGRLKLLGRSLPDFERAYIVGVSFDSQEWQVLKKKH